MKEILLIITSCIVAIIIPYLNKFVVDNNPSLVYMYLITPAFYIGINFFIIAKLTYKIDTSFMKLFFHNSVFVLGYLMLLNFMNIYFHQMKFDFQYTLGVLTVLLVLNLIFSYLFLAIKKYAKK